MVLQVLPALPRLQLEPRVQVEPHVRVVPVRAPLRQPQARRAPAALLAGVEQPSR